MKICLHHWETRPTAPSLLNPSLPRPLKRVIFRALEKDPRHRYQTIVDLLHAFQETLEAPTFSGHLSSYQQDLCQEPDFILFRQSALSSEYRLYVETVPGKHVVNTQGEPSSSRDRVVNVKTLQVGSYGGSCTF
jgi:serine/threonine protein kinase